MGSRDPVPVMQGGDNLEQIGKLLTALNPLFGGGTTRTSGGTTTSNETASVSGETNTQSNELLQKIMGDSNGADIDAMVQGILAKAKNEFGAQAIEGNAAGVRGYSDTVQSQLRNDAMAKATAQAAQMKLQAMNESNRTAASLVSAKMTNTRSVQQAQTRPGTATSTGATTLGKVTALLGGAAAARNLLGNGGLSGLLGKKKVPGESGPEQLSGPTEPDSSLMTDQAFGASPDGGISGVGLSSGGDPNLLLAPGRASSAALTPAVVDPGLAPIDTGVPTSAAFAAPGSTIDPSMVITPDTSSTADILAAQGIPAGTAMPPAGTGTPMPPAIRDPAVFGDGGGAEDLTGSAGNDVLSGGDAVDVIPSDLSASVGYNSLPYADIGAEGMDAAILATDTMAASNPVGAIYAAADQATGGELTKSIYNLPIIGEPIKDINMGAFDAGGEVGGGAIDAGLSAGGDLLSSGEGVLNSAGDFVDSATGGCYITTAATLNGELDNGFTLTALRNFRDDYMLQDPQRRADLLEYYAVAPDIVKRISESPDSDNTWHEIRLRYLAPAVIAYVTGNNEKAYEIYTKMVGFAKNQAMLIERGMH